MNEFHMHHLTREMISQRAKGGCAIVVPLAATEQHGPHLPVYTDSLICEHVVSGAVRQAAETVDILVSPVLTIGCSEHHLSFGGTLSYSSATYLQMLRDVGESLVTGGFRKIIFVNAHGGNAPMMLQTVNDLVVKHPIWGASTSYWSVSGAALDELQASEVGLVPGHAGGFETAAVMALRPDLVRTDRLETVHVIRDWIHTGAPGTFIGKHGELTGQDGYTDAPYQATAAAGRIYLDAITKCVADWLVTTIQAMENGGEI
ncbi:creatininase family protein [Paenibacillus eucommiae]|uniref:Creatinine amidohydrolase n=1 Tax=Paenibacillus eucommiae TaxID=1355755 RepID=A0ABS4ILS6_9BACL|nr:creatininase family protein [Paenibacillus eucommiae]MBP1988521.1 creatinine amidohydrolase [Paenibacillus eucommiae]